MSNMKATFALIIIDAFVAYCQSFVFKKVFEPYEAEQIAPETLRYKNKFGGFTL